jgi:hypothetical protein
LPARQPLREHAACAGHRAERRLDVDGHLLDATGIGAVDLDRGGAAHAGRQHLVARLDRHPPQVRHARNTHGAIELGDQLLPRHAGPPVALGLQRDDRLRHAGRRGVRHRARAADLAEHALDLRHLLQQRAHALQHGGGFRVGHAGRRRRHVEHGTLVERRHELGRQRQDDGNRRQHDEQRAEDHPPAPPHREPEHGRVRGDDRARDRLLALGANLAAHEPYRERGRQRHREQSRERHRVRLGERERLEQPALGRLEREHGQERHGDHEQREEHRAADLAQRADHDVAPLAGPAGRLPAFQPLVHVLDHDDRSIDHRADRDRDAAERHDVGAQTLRDHGDEREHHRYRQRQHRDQCAAQVPEEQHDHERDDQQLLEQHTHERVDRGTDQFGTVVRHDELHAGRQRAAHLVEPPLHAVDHAQRVLALPHDHDAADHLTAAVQLGDPRRGSGPRYTLPRSRS